MRSAAVYAEVPNRDNVLGPTHLFFSTYLESIWITSWLAGAFLLRQADQLDEETAAAVESVAEESATLIGEFNEGLSNRQTWNSAALVALRRLVRGRGAGAERGRVAHRSAGPPHRWLPGR